MATQVSYVKADGVNVFYRHAGDPSAPTVLLLHGFPSSSHMFRNLIPILAGLGYRVIAPDLPSFGFTDVPAERAYAYTFASLADTLAAFVAALDLGRYAVYIFDYGAPVGLRLAANTTTSPPSSRAAVAAIVSQNGNAYAEGLDAPFWDPLKQYWASGAARDRDALRPALEMATTRAQYEVGSPRPAAVPPESYWLDQALMDLRPGNNNKDVQLDLLYDYRTNLALYPRFQEYLRESRVPVLAAWGRNDFIFPPAGAEAFARDVERFELKWLDAGHFALETNEREMAGYMHEFFQKYKVFE
ncbi:uncharacterized protein E0L32_011237 [Thyridium curvatum]|uniref:AB hydrolase-1 domain-containing protein n=1 Tax=Thyridium curvatum TaxID=1093900 RepID=A0A507BI12_9PEZI|nr:uncharacterized protein E0L32_011237 [Thyridium curvatum]TPX19076.1 hypothetical protein E0L32_011237 [Thyridium curvatum]